ncbi:MAG TPA: hypothetical protein DEF00_04915 [Candidatus Taylorbacteria bacterium]|nr:hypothetical protein [Candidatus Taylorbacteria bacterium]
MKEQARQVVLRSGRPYAILMKQLEKLHGPVRMLHPAFKQALNESRVAFEKDESKLGPAMAWRELNQDDF